MRKKQGTVPFSPLRVSVVDSRGRPVRAPGLARWLASTAPASARGDVSIALVSDARIRALNRTYRKKDRTTDVLSFSVGSEVQSPGSWVHVPGSKVGPRSRVARVGSPSQARTTTRRPRTSDRTPDPTSKDPGPRTPDPGPYLGDIVIARGIAARQAREMGHSLAVELRVLALHGLLHLLGYDHERDRGEMRRVERRLRRKGGLRDGLIERAMSPAPRRHR